MTPSKPSPATGRGDDGSSAAPRAEFRIAVLARHFGWYFTSSAGRALLGVALLPLYVTHLTTTEFGVLATANVLAAALRTFASPGIAGGMLRFVSEARSHGDDRAARRYFTTALVSSTLLGLLVAALTAGAAWVLAGGLLGEEWWTILLSVAVVTIVVPPRELIEMELRASTKVRSAAVLAFAYQAAVTGGVAYLLLVRHDGVIAILWLTAAIGGLFSAIALAARWRALRGETSMSALRAMLQFGLPTAPALLSDWAVQFSDRLFLGALVNLSATGVYAFGSRIAQLLQDVVNTSVYQAWAPYVFWSHDREGAPLRFARATTYFMFLGMGCALPLALGTPALLRIIGDRGAYAGAGSVVWLIALSYWFALLRQLFFAPAGITKRTGVTLFAWLASAALNVALNALLIPRMGMLGAAWATLASYVAGAGLAHAVTRGLWHIPYEWPRLGATLAAGLVTYAGWTALAVPGPALVVLMITTAGPIATYLVLLLVLRAVRREELGALAAVLRGRMRRAPQLPAA